MIKLIKEDVSSDVKETLLDLGFEPMGPYTDILYREYTILGKGYYYVYVNGKTGEVEIFDKYTYDTPKNIPEDLKYIKTPEDANRLNSWCRDVLLNPSKTKSIRTEGFGIEDAPGLYKRIYKIISDNHINADIVDTDDSDDYGFVELDVDGDWKHDHLRLKYLLNQAFNTVIWREKENFPSDEDCFRAIYMVYLADPKDDSYTESVRKRIRSKRKF